MTKGGVHKDRQVDQFLRYLALMVPLLLGIYGVFIEQGLIDSAVYMGRGALVTITAFGVLLAVFVFLFWSKQQKYLALLLILFHGYAAAYTMVISGFASPFSVAWLLLQLASFQAFGDKGLRYSIFSTFGIAVASAATVIAATDDLVRGLIVVLAGFSIVFVGGVLAAALRRPEESKEDPLPESTLSPHPLQEDRLLTIVNNMADGFFSVDHEGRVELYNASALNILNTNQTLTNQPIESVLPIRASDGSELDMFELLKKSRGLTIRDDVHYQDEDEERHLEVTYSPIRSSSPDIKESDYILIIRDITKVQSLNQERDEFISVVSHELRTPITIAEGTISNLQLMIDQPKVKKAALASQVTQTHSQIKFLAKMVNDLSTLSRAERGLGDEVEKIEVRPLVEELYNEYLPQVKKRSLTLDLELSSHLGHVRSSRLYLKELLQNLLSNAMKYTKEGGIVLAVSRDDEAVHFSVQDTGIGISKTDQKRIFERFYRSEDYRTRETGGTGLGLYVATKLARKLNTNLSLKSRLNNGSTFSFDLPFDVES